MKETRYHRDLGATAACRLRLGEEWYDRYLYYCFKLNKSNYFIVLYNTLLVRKCMIR